MSGSLRLLRIEHCFAAFLLFCGWTLDLPATDPDDLFFLSAPVTWAATNELRAPALAGLLTPFGSDNYYLQTPHAPITLGLWFKLVGVSHLAAKSFHYTFYVICMWLLGVVLLKLGISLSFRLLFQWLTWLYLMSWHFRPEVVAMVPLLGAACILTRTPCMVWSSAVAVWLAGLAAIMAPNFIPVALLVLFFALRQALASARTEPGGMKQVGCLAVLVPASHTLLFHGLIQGEWRAFLRQFLAHAAARNQPFDFPILVEKLTFGWNDRLVLPWVLVAMVVLLLATRSQHGGSERWVSWLALVALSLQIAVRARSTAQITFLALLGAVLILAFQAERRSRAFNRVAVLVAGLAILMVYYGTPLALLQDRTPPQQEEIARWRAMAAREVGRELVIDAVVARFVFDWKVPPQSRHYQYRHPLPRFEPWPGDTPGTGLWLVSAPLLHKYTPALAVRDYERLRVGPVGFRTMARHPYEILVAGSFSLPASIQP
jgi:hypothetical protein